MATQRLTQAERREQTRRALLEAARRVFGERGFGAASLDEIAETAGLTRGALYYNFPDGKEDLFLALLDERLAQRADAVEGAIAPASDLDELSERARAAADDAQAAVLPNREWQLLTFEFALHAARNPRFAQRHVEVEATIRRAIEEVVAARAADFGVEPAIPPGHLAIALNALGMGLALDALVDEHSVPEGLFGEVVALLVRGMAAAAAAPAGNNKGGRK